MDPRPYGTLHGRDLEERFIIVYSIAQFFLPIYINHNGRLRASNNSKKREPRFTDPEMIATIIIKELSFSSYSWRAWHHFLASECKHLFPDLVDRAQWMKRRVVLTQPIEAIRIYLLHHIGVCHESLRIVDSAPIPFLKFCRALRRSNKDWRGCFTYNLDGKRRYDAEIGQADIGYCASKKEHYFGMKLHMSCTPDGVPVCWQLTPASHSDISALRGLVEADPWRDRVSDVLGDKGYVGEGMRNEIKSEFNVNIWAPPRRNANSQWEQKFKLTHSRMRKVVEKAFALMSEHVSFQKVQASSWRGFLSEMGAKIFAQTLFSLEHVCLSLFNPHHA